MGNKWEQNQRLRLFYKQILGLSLAMIEPRLLDPSKGFSQINNLLIERPQQKSEWLSPKTINCEYKLCL